MTKSNIENSISKSKNYLINLTVESQISEDLDYLVSNFCGTVVNNLSDISKNINETRIYFIGDAKLLLKQKGLVYIIREFSFDFEDLTEENYIVIGLGKVPINIHNAGVFYRRFFDDSDLFARVESEHKFQNLTESNKDSLALRKGIYLSKIRKDEKDNLHFNLLRCSSNLTGPTDNFRETDNLIVNSINEAVKFDFEKETELNHVLAQIYLNKKKDNLKEVKAKIKAHSDKTKDMPKEGLIVFCTFYDKNNFENLTISKTDKFDWCYKKSSGLTRLLFKLKSTVNDDSLEKEFSVTLYPNSVFLIPLSTNRLYTHEIRPSVLNIDRIPIRMGYVIRCSNLEAIYKDNQTYIKDDNNFIKLEQMDNINMEELRDSYYEENKSEKVVKYGKIHFSMNSGDYEKPIL